MKRSVIIVAGGSGTRMGSATPKQFIEIKGVPVLVHTVNAFNGTADEVIVVLPKAHLETWKVLANAHSIQIKAVEGGSTRSESVLNGIHASTGELLAIHDGVRPFVSSQLIEACFEAAQEHGAAIPVIPISSSIRQVSDTTSQAIDRSSLRAVQTPQCFQRQTILSAFEASNGEGATDEATLVEQNGDQVHLLEGSDTNIKLTTPFDLKLAEAILS